MVLASLDDEGVAWVLARRGRDSGVRGQGAGPRDRQKKQERRFAWGRESGRRGYEAREGLGVRGSGSEVRRL